MSEGFDAYYEWLGIRPKDQPPDHYRLLGVERFETSERVIENAADRQMSHVRTFQSGEHSELSQRILNEIAAARVTLLDAGRKARYDEQLRARLSAATTPSSFEQPAAPSAQPLPRARPLAAAPAPAQPAPRPTQPATDPNPYAASAAPPAQVEAAKPLWQRPATFVAVGGGAMAIVLFGFLFVSFPASSDTSGPMGGPVTVSEDAPVTAGPALETSEEAEEPTGPRIADLRVGPARSSEPDTPEGDPDDGRAIVRNTSIGTETTDAGSGRAIPLGETLKDQDHGLRFRGRHRVTLAGTKGKVNFDRPLTAEMWIRFDPDQKRCRLLADGDTSAGRPESGWKINSSHGPRGSIVSWQLYYPPGFRNTGAQGHATGLPPFNGDWHHLAISSVPLGPNRFRFRVFIDGKKYGERDRSVPLIVPGDDELYIGSSGADAETDVLHADLRAFRISLANRYEAEFTPPTVFTNDADTFALLDFSRGSGNTIPDLSGNGHHGAIHGAEWISLEDDPLRVAAGEPEPAPEPQPEPVTRPQPAATGYALEFNGTEGLQVTGTRKLVTIDKRFTVEMWLSLSPEGTQHYVVGNRNVNRMREAFGWFLQVFEQKGKWRSLLRRDINLPAPDDEWHHLALAFDPSGGGGETRIAFYFDGKRIGEYPYGNKPTGLVDLHVGVIPEYYINARQFRGRLRALRLSSNVRYTDDFEPPQSFGKDAETLALLDFSRGSGDTLPDLSGNGHHGRIVGGEWIKLDGGPVASPDSSPEPRVTIVPAKGPDEGSQPSGPKGLPVPAEEEREKALAQIKRLFAEQYDDLREPAQKVALARRLLQLAGETRDDAAAKYVLLAESRDLAAAAANMQAATQAISELDREFEVETWPMQVEAYNTAADEVRLPNDRLTLAGQALVAADLAVREDAFGAADELARTALALATRARDAAMRDRARAARDAIEVRRGQYEAAREASQALEEDPDDPEANTAWGTYLCFVRNEWATGLPHLAKAGNEALRDAAKRDLARPVQSTDQLATAEAWREAARTAPRDYRDAFLGRAKYWYQTALPGLNGLDRIRAQKSLQDLQDP